MFANEYIDRGNWKTECKNDTKNVSSLFCISPCLICKNSDQLCLCSLTMKDREFNVASKDTLLDRLSKYDDTRDISIQKFLNRAIEEYYPCK